VFGSGQKCVCLCVYWNNTQCLVLDRDVCVCVYWSDTQCLVLARGVCVLLSKLTAHSLILMVLLHSASLGTSLATCSDVHDANFLQGFIISCPRLCHLLAMSLFRMLF